MRLWIYGDHCAANGAIVIKGGGGSRTPVAAVTAKPTAAKSAKTPKSTAAPAAAPEALSLNRQDSTQQNDQRDTIELFEMIYLHIFSC